MTDHRSGATATPFRAPALSALAAVRDRGDAMHEHGARLRDEGFRAGYEVGLQTAAADTDRAIASHQRAADDLAVAIAALESGAASLAHRDAATLAELEREAVVLAVELASEIVGRELAVAERPVVDALARAAQLLPDRGIPRIRVHPDDAATVHETVTSDTGRWTPGVDVIADPTIERGGCVVDIDACRIDAQIGPAIERLRAALG